MDAKLIEHIAIIEKANSNTNLSKIPPPHFFRAFLQESAFDYLLTVFFKFAPALNLVTFIAAILIALPVCGFLPLTKSMEEQKSILENTFNEWKGNLGQVDDILIIGVKV